MGTLSNKTFCAGHSYHFRTKLIWYMKSKTMVDIYHKAMSDKADMVHIEKTMVDIYHKTMSERADMVHDERTMVDMYHKAMSEMADMVHI